MRVKELLMTKVRFVPTLSLTLVTATGSQIPISVLAHQPVSDLGAVWDRLMCSTMTTVFLRKIPLLVLKTNVQIRVLSPQRSLLHI